ncbi:UDP-N-acetylmuramoyl-tripeptide--D-alanyl-D-alanine ligase [Paraliobacillus salinarum]|uniref:UDP-N-acetylmuramoyl-tripeptide--D-alanyl-D- alanine ligase n=1 Tax=Paraliobacillus salinarum TaxID=1158996 RepID=UPI0015F5C7F6|nr:UDP-N-acetylmuramoyl-tripeptide--D-alanyl-D-alanine ligase [Paraliobacillus salinarum]
MLFLTNEINELFQNTAGDVLGKLPICKVTTDSRVSTDRSLFVPLKGDKFNGHEFIDQAIKNGAIAAIWDQSEPIPRYVPTDFPMFFVEDTLTALQQLAVYYRNKINPIVIGVTGSNGKTTTKDILSAVLSKQFKTHQTKGNLNNHIGLPLTVLDMPTNTEVLVLEMGMNHFGEIHALSQIATPNYAIITNIGESHIEYLKTRAGIAQAKAEIISGLDQNGCIYVDGDEPLLEPHIKELHAKAIGFDSNEQFQITDVTVTSEGSSFQFNNHGYTIPLMGKHHAKNASYAIELAKDLGMEHEQIQLGLSTMAMTGMRFESLRGLQGSTIINDSYNASPTSMKAAIEVVREMKGFNKKVVVLGDMFELGEHVKKYHQQIASSLTDEIDFVFTIGEYSKELNKALRSSKPYIEAKHFESKEVLLDELRTLLDNTTLVLLKASRGMKLEEVCESIVLKQ